MSITSEDVLKAIIGNKISIEEAQFFLIEEAQSQFDLIESVVEELSLKNGLDLEYLWEALDQISDQDLLQFAEDAKGYESPTGGLTAKGRKAAGGHLQAPVTTPPSKLKRGSKAWKRRKSFCARMGGMKKKNTSAKTAKDPNSRINLALKKWNC